MSASEAIFDSCSLEIFERDIAYSCIDNKISTPKRKVTQMSSLEWWTEFWIHVDGDDDLPKHLGFNITFSKPVNVKCVVSIVGTEYSYEEYVRTNANSPTDKGFSIEVLDYIDTEQLYDIDAFLYGMMNILVTVEFNPLTANPILTLNGQERLLRHGPTITLSIGDQNVEISKALLMHISPVFNAMFTLDTKEAATLIVKITDFAFITIQVFADYCSDNPPAQTTTDVLIELLSFADKYGIHRLMTHIEAYFADNITTENIFTVATFAKSHCRDDLMKTCVRFYHDNYRSLAVPPEHDDIEKYLFTKVFSKLSFCSS